MVKIIFSTHLSNAREAQEAGTDEMNYSDDTEGWMRVHIGQRRGQLACDRYTKRSLADHARAHKVWGVRWRKLDLATILAFRGLIDSDGNLRDGWPR